MRTIGCCITRWSRPTRRACAAQLSEIIRGAMERFADGDAHAGVGAVGVAVPGHVEPESGTIRLAVNLGGTAGEALPLGRCSPTRWACRAT